MRVIVNGKPRDLDEAITILDFLQQHDINPAIVAVEHNGDIVRRERFPSVAIHEGDTLEIVHMVGGG